MDRGIVDSHQHVWQIGHFDYPWMSPDVEVLYRDYLPETNAEALASLGVTRTVLVQASNSVAESHWMLDLADEHEQIAGVVGWVDLASSSVGAQLDELQARPAFKGVRHIVESEPDDAWLVRADVLAGFRELARRKVPYDLLVHTRHLGHVLTLANECPDLPLVVDHCAKPPIATAEFDAWARAIERVAAIDRIHCKISGLVTEAKHDAWSVDQLRPYVDHVVSCFGIDRLLFGSDYPVCLLAATYAQVLGAARDFFAGYPESAQGAVFAGNAERFYAL